MIKNLTVLFIIMEIIQLLWVLHVKTDIFDLSNKNLKKNETMSYQNTIITSFNLNKNFLLSQGFLKYDFFSKMFRCLIIFIIK